MIDIKSLELLELEREMEKIKEKKYRAKQIYKWIQKGVASFSEMTDIPSELQKTLNNNYYIPNLKLENKFNSMYDETIKYLIKLGDKKYIESVLMKYKHGYTVCVSTQVGCKMGCSFCATGRNGFKRNLSASEMIAQIHLIQKDLKERISNVVLMGMGEPLDNYENVVKFLKLVTSPWGLNIGMRHVSVSTCGLVDKIYKLANESMSVTLSVSLHAPNDELRTKLMKVNRIFKLKDLMKACRFYEENTGRRISYQYAMIDRLNDTQKCAKDLCNILKGQLCHVNLIPVNKVDGSSFIRSNRDRINKFKDILESNGISVTIRRTLGDDIGASCGQLAGRRYEEV